MTNPFDFGRTMLEAWEKNMGDILERLTRDESFLKNMSQAVGGSLDIKRQMETHVENYLQSVNVPTRTDLARMFTYLHRIEGRLLDLEDRFDRLAAPAPPAAAATAPRSPSPQDDPAGPATETAAPRARQHRAVKADRPSPRRGRPARSPKPSRKRV